VLRKEPRARQRRRVRRIAHLVNAELPLHKGDDKPMMKAREDRSRPQPSVRQVLQCGQERIQPRLVRGGGHAVMSGVGLLHQHLAGVGGSPASSLQR
jgi:hypothetical protein